MASTPSTPSVSLPSVYPSLLSSSSPTRSVEYGSTSFQAVDSPCLDNDSLNPGPFNYKVNLICLSPGLPPTPTTQLTHNQRESNRLHRFTPLFLGGLNYIPPASGTNYGSWAIVGLLFGLSSKGLVAMIQLCSQLCTRLFRCHCRNYHFLCHLLHGCLRASQLVGNKRPQE